MKESHVNTNTVTKKGLIMTCFQAVKFGMVGILNSAVDAVVFAFLVYVAGLVPAVSKAVSYSAGVINSYFFNSRWTFREQSRDNLHQKLRFVAVSVLGCAVGIGAVQLFIYEFGWVEWLSNIASICVTVGINFLGSKLFVFRAKR